MLENALIFLVNTVFGLFTMALLVRFYVQWARAPYRNPLSEFLSALTDFMVLPARRVIPGLWGLDLATLVLAWLIQLLELFIIFLIKGHPLAAAGSAFVGLALLAGLMIVKFGLYIVIVVVVVQAVMSWINPYTPLAPLFNSMSRPFLRVFQKLIPPIGNVDLSPLFVIVICQLLLMLPVAYLEMTLSQWLG
ncbi:MAG: osmotic-shock protein [Betaproteobacteria bacterium RIFCSPLOWO2_12_FULL_62_13]|nr:MAG: osmotic-shock protein [Betaproteobacteria bacterium RIFCSPLOWO2_12_FULL_62_13]